MRHAPPTTRRRRRLPILGFTLVELLVVIAIIGVLVGLLLPAIQAAREAARRTECINNLRQIGIGLQNYHSTYRHFPPGSKIVRRNFDPGISWRVVILPYLEQDVLYDTIAPLPDGGAKNWNPKLQAVALYVCPSAEPPIVDGFETVKAYYAAVSGAKRDDERFYLTGSCGEIYTNGVFYPDSYTRSSKITDGLANTLAVGERYCKYRNWMDGAQAVWKKESQAATTPPLDICTEATKNVDDPINTELSTKTNDLYFHSDHSGGAQFCFMDGSVHFLNESMDVTLFRNMATKSGGETLQGDR